MRQQAHRFGCGLVTVVLCGLTGLAQGQDDLREVMARLVPTDALQMRYREVRYLSLMTEPWRGAGYFYARPPQQMIKLQLQPTREIMVVNGARLWYYDTEYDIRHHATLSQDDFASLEVMTFLALINGDRRQLEAVFDMEFSSNKQQWQIVLRPQPGKATSKLPLMHVSGPDGGSIRRITVFKSDGDQKC